MKVKLTFSLPQYVNLIPFWIGLFAGLMAAFFSLVYPSLNRWVSPITSEYNVIEMLRPRLQEKKLNFKLKKDLSLIPQSHAASTFDEAKAYGVVDLDTGEIIAEKGLSERLPIASLTKVMTAVVALDLVSPDESFYISKRAAAEIPTKIGVIPGQTMKLNELLHAILMTSANDAAEAIRDGIDRKYNQDGVFIEAMNIKAQAIGLKNSHFANPQGFDSPENYSSVEDLALLTQYALINYPLIAEIVKKDYQFLAANYNHKQFDLYNWNGLIGVYPNTYGMKIGNTGKAGVTTIVVSEREGKRIVAIVLGAPGILKRDLWAADLLDLGFEQQLSLKPVKVTEKQLKAKYASWKYF